MDVVRQPEDQIAKCSMELGFSFNQTVFDIVPEAINSVRRAVDDGVVTFYDLDVRQETYQRIKHQQMLSERLSQQEIERFLAGKAYILGFLAADEPSEVWGADPWDAQYLGVTKKELLLATRILRANGLVDPGSVTEYMRPSDKLLAEQASSNQEAEIFQPSQQLSRLSLPNKEVLLADMETVLNRRAVLALLVVDLDNFKTVNDALGHLEGDACLDRVVSTIGNVIGRRGKVYRWGGDEFAILLPDFSSEEAQATAERIRCAVEQEKPGGEIAVTTSIGVCASDRTDSKSVHEILHFAEKAMYESKRTGRNRVTVWPMSSNVSKVAHT
jgi:diguanylate cyclase (GGDEF)-like protein